jgi:hypothetical protein
LTRENERRFRMFRLIGRAIARQMIPEELSTDVRVLQVMVVLQRGYELRIRDERRRRRRMRK